MKLRHLFATLSLAVVTGAGVAAGVSSGNAQKAEADNKTVYFNLTSFGPYYGDNNEYDTKFFVWAYNSNANPKVSDSWFTATPVDGYTRSTYSIECDESYMGFIVVRGSKDSTPGWVDDSAGRWNKTCDMSRDSSARNFFWVTGKDFGFGNDYKSYIVKDTTLDFLGGSSHNMTYNFNERQYKLTSFEISSSQKFVVNYGNETFGYSDLEAGCRSMFNSEDDNYISVKNPSEYEIYLKENDGTKTLWAQIDSDIEAANWAEDFVKGVGCKSPYDEKPAHWDEFETSFNSLSDGGKDVLIAAQKSNAPGATYVQQAAFIHDMCVAKYAGCNVFMKRDGGGSRSAAVIPMNYQPLTESNGTTIYIAVASILTLTAVGGFFFIRRKRA